MTEVEWQTCSWPPAMVEFLWHSGSKRKLRLLAVACCRRIEHLVADARCRAAVAAVEGLVEGAISANELEAVRAGCETGPRPAGGWLDPGHDAAHVLRHLPYSCLHDDPAAHLLDFFSFIQTAAACAEAPVNSGPWQAAWRAEEKAECDLVRDIFGNPFRPVAIDPTWRTDTALTLARQMYDERNFGAMPILADALQEAGCDCDDVLNHCRDASQVHVRGCWVVDEVRGKA